MGILLLGRLPRSLLASIDMQVRCLPDLDQRLDV